MTRRRFGASLGAFTPTHTPDQAAEALRGAYPPEHLARLARHVHKAAHRRRRTNPRHALHQLAALLTRASQPPPVAFSLYATQDATQPLEVVLGDGTRTTVVPAGRADWELADLTPHGSIVYAGPAHPGDRAARALTMPPHVVAAADQIRAWGRVDWPNPMLVKINETVEVDGYRTSPRNSGGGPSSSSNDPPPDGTPAAG